MNRDRREDREPMKRRSPAEMIRRPGAGHLADSESRPRTACPPCPAQLPTERQHPLHEPPTLCARTDAPQRTQRAGPTPRQADTLPTIHGSERAADQKPRNAPHTLTTHGRTHTEATGRTESAGPRQTIHRQHPAEVRSCRILERLTRCRVYTYRGIPFLSCSR